MIIESTINNKLEEYFAPHFLEVQNESHMHSVPANSETHFRVVMASEKFHNASRIQRHRMVNEVLKNELAGAVHALSLKLYTPEEWEQGNKAPTESPKCHSKN